MREARGMTNLPAPPPVRFLVTVSRILLILALVLAFCVLAGTLYAVYRGPNAGPIASFGGNRPAGTGANRGAGADRAGETAGQGPGVFTGIGRLRIPVAAGHGAEKATLILSIAFPYPPQDRAFAEELASRVGDFRRIAAEYFSSCSAEELRSPDEDALKAGLLRRYNAILMLGNIRALYFNDLLIFE
jgi:flagellar basal body-associated protein FliL